MLQAAAQAAYRRNAALLEQAQRTVLRQHSNEARAREIARHQALAANLSVRTSAAVLGAQGVSPSGATVIPTSFLADLAVIEEMISGADDLSVALLTQVLVGDAGKSAGGVYTASRSRQVGYVRYLVGDSCERCAVLAGRWYRWSDGFLRHPHCDCIHLPADRAASSELVSDPGEAFDKGLIRGLSKAQEQAIRDGADITQVVNAKRGVRMVNFAGRRVQTTTAGTTVRAAAGRSLGDLQKVAGQRYRVSQRARLTPESIYRYASDRADAVRLLKLYGYIT